MEEIRLFTKWMWERENHTKTLLTPKVSISSLSEMIPLYSTSFFAAIVFITFMFSDIWCKLSHAISALSHADVPSCSPDMKLSNSACVNESDSAVMFSMNEIAQHCKNGMANKWTHIEQ